MLKRSRTDQIRPTREIEGIHRKSGSVRASSLIALGLLMLAATIAYHRVQDNERASRIAQKKSLNAHKHAEAGANYVVAKFMEGEVPLVETEETVKLVLGPDGWNRKIPVNISAPDDQTWEPVTTITPHGSGLYSFEVTSVVDGAAATVKMSFSRENQTADGDAEGQGWLIMSTSHRAPDGSVEPLIRGKSARWS
jgi:hypothetical protein